ncbi:hypothetical protein M8C21_026946 [Ambrosia artemisiifolia]|uniref:Peptidase M48 domain-containing protein n=1 Tax=Ambrosia artemisiifolia TaxID=4212 RepID=A0AAD5G3F5_AMBAR|nr:hypothetical protein M8C21_026946 [Ambrosia artemisiifolia]
MSAYVERVIGESQFRMMKAEFEGKVLAEMHPDRVRVTNILNRVVQVTTLLKNGSKRRERAKSERAEWMKLTISYLEMMKWEVLVVEDDAAFACCLPGGKIVVFTGLFKHLTTDDEIATIICHEVAHAVMRHVYERLAMNLWHAFGRQIFYMVVRPDLDPREVFCMLDLPFSPRMETEVHNMELMLMGFALYDTRVAPKVFEEMDTHHYWILNNTLRY